MRVGERAGSRQRSVVAADKYLVIETATNFICSGIDVNPNGRCGTGSLLSLHFSSPHPTSFAAPRLGRGMRVLG